MFSLLSLQEAFRLASNFEARRKASTLERKVSLISETLSTSASSSSTSSSKKKKRKSNKKTSSTKRKHQDDSRTVHIMARKAMKRINVGSFILKRHLNHYISGS